MSNFKDKRYVLGASMLGEVITCTAQYNGASSDDDDIKSKKSNEIPVKTTEQLQKELEDALKSVSLTQVKTEGGFLGLGDHKVTGTELNNSLSEIQDNFSNVIQGLSKSVVEIGTIYQMLDKNHEVTTQQILITLNQAQEGIKKAEKANKDIKKLIDTQRKAIDKLVEFKNEVDDADLDKMSQDISFLLETIEASCENQKDIIANLEREVNRIDEVYEKITQIENNINLNGDSIDIIISDYKKNRFDIKGKLMISYGIAGGSILLSVIILILNIAGVL